LTRPVFEPTIYRTRCEHTNHNTLDAVNYRRDIKCVILGGYGV